jgi:lipid II:glycine glycyltransferase (peptidoglycan interpeptide bridge formation enzyme)
MSIDIIYNNKLIYLYGVSATENRNLLGMYNMQWEAIKYCINNKIPYYDFGGVFCEENDITNKDFGLYNFKKGYCYKGFLDIVPDITITYDEEVK